MTVECRMTKSYIRTDEEEDTPVYGISFVGMSMIGDSDSKKYKETIL